MKQANFVGKVSLVSVICFLLTIQVSFAQENDEKQIKTTYQEYIKAIKKHDGLKAVQCIDSKTIAHYDTIWNLIKTGDSVQIAALSFTDMMTVLNFRQLFWQNNLDYKTFADFDGASFFVFGIKLESMGSVEPPKWTLGEISINGDFAQAQCLDGRKELPVPIQFYKENNRWNFNLISLMDILDDILEGIIKQKGMPTQLFVLIVLDNKYGYGQVSPNIWKPIAE